MRPLLLLLAGVVSACRPTGTVSSSPNDAASTPNEAAQVPEATLPEAGPPTPPPYELSADLATRTAAARDLFPRTTFPALSTRVEAGVFLLISPQGTAMLSAGAAQLRRALAFYYDGHSTPSDPSSPPPFARHADHAVSIYLFATRRAFLDFAHDREGVDAEGRRLLGFYLPDRNDLVISGQEGLGTLTHELIHSFPEFPDEPRWMNEGLASLFEQPLWDPDGTMHGQSNGRYRVVQDALAADAGLRPSLVALFALSNHDFLGGSPLTPEGVVDKPAKAAAELLHYGMARSFCQWLDSKHHKLWAFHHAWRDGFAGGDRTGEKAFASTMGRSVAEWNADWAAWVGAQPR